MKSVNKSYSDSVNKYKITVVIRRIIEKKKKKNVIKSHEEEKLWC